MAKKKLTLSEMIDQTLREVISGRTFVPAFDASDDEDVLRVAQETKATDSDDLDDKIGNWYQDQIEFDSVKWTNELASELWLISNEISEVIRKAIPARLRKGGLEMGRVEARAEYDRHDDLDVTISFDVVVRRERDLSGEQASRWQEVLIRALTENLEPDQINDYGTLSDYELIYKINEPAQTNIDAEIEFFTKEARTDIAKRSKHIDKLLSSEQSEENPVERGKSTGFRLVVEYPSNIDPVSKIVKAVGRDFDSNSRFSGTSDLWFEFSQKNAAARAASRVKKLRVKSLTAHVLVNE